MWSFRHGQDRVGEQVCHPEGPVGPDDLNEVAVAVTVVEPTGGSQRLTRSAKAPGSAPVSLAFLRVASGSWSSRRRSGPGSSPPRTAPDPWPRPRSPWYAGTR